MTVTVTTFATDLYQPNSIAFDNLGNLYCSSIQARCIFKISPDNVITVFISLNNPRGLAFDSQGYLYCALYADNFIVKINTNGSVVKSFTNTVRPYGLAFDNLGNLYYSSVANNSIYKLNTDTAVITTFASGLNSPRGLAFDSYYNLYCSSSDGSCIFKISPDQVMTTFASAITQPEGIVFDSIGNLYCSTSVYNLIKIDSFGNISTLVSGYSFFGLAFDSMGLLYGTQTMFNSILTINFLTQTPTITNFLIPTKIYGDIPFQITPPSSNSSGSFSYTSSDLSVATISGNIITIVGAGSSTITATQESTTDYTSGIITTTFQVNQSTPTNPVIMNNSDELLYFMNTSSIYGNILDNLSINYDLITQNYKVLTGNNITITK